MNIYPVLKPSEIEEAKTRMSEIRFDCVVKLFDFVQIDIESGIFGQTLKPLPPQWFALTEKLSLEFIEYSDEYAIGLAVKQAWLKLKEHIKQYENK
jgi:hypothetical protein